MTTAARSEADFERLVGPHRRELHAHCYRMLGSVHDADDALQEAMLRAWRSLGRFEGRSSLRSWLYRIATNTCLDLIAKRPQRVLPIDYAPASDPHDGPGRPLVESVWVEPYPDDALGAEQGPASPEARYERREAVELAFVAALQHLPARQRAVLILREVLGFSAREVAEALETTEASVNSALQRARATLEQKLPERSQQETLRALGDEGTRRLVGRFVDAWERGDVDAVVSMLTEDARVTMPPMATWYDGRDAVRVFLEKFAFAQAWQGDRFAEGRRQVRLLPTRASGQVALGAYRLIEEAGVYRPYNLQVLRLVGDRIAEIDGFVMPELVPRHGLPAELRD